MARVHGNMLRSPTRRQAGSRRQKALGSPGRVAKIDKALAASPELSDEPVAEVKRLRDEGERLHKTGLKAVSSVSMLSVPVWCSAQRS